ncbi:hypothetical protein HY417_04105, partial [Candidatus Kaiserbacteria bacterium]|nr:hypothetical protein [Candidatus Kaiserbacteria bacterium]
GWYFFLKGERATIAEGDIGRGVGLPQPIGQAIGSTYENIVSSFSTLVGGIVQSGEEKPPQLAQVGKTPTAGYDFIGSGSSVRLRFVERGAGYIFDVSPETGTLKRLTNTLVPRTYEALVAGNRVVMRGIDEDGYVTTVVGEITMSTSTKEVPATLKQRSLPDSIRSIAINPTGEEIFYIVDTLRGGAGIRASWDEKNQKKIFDSAVLGWQIDFLPDGRITVTENASDNAAGHTYLVQENSLQPLVAGLGLTFLPHPESSMYLYGESAGALLLFARLSATSSPILLPIRTIADKCVWSPVASLVAYCAVPQHAPPTNFLDTWYRGETHTSDAWWHIDVSANSAELLYSSASVVLDVENPTIDGSGDYIAFTNAIDKSLWLLRISEN